MSVRLGLLALFADGPKYGYQLRTEFEARTGGTWPLNVGQVYTTLERLERDGLVVAAGSNDEGRTVYAMTDAGRSALAAWFATPVAEIDRPRNELAIKLLMAATTEGVDVPDVVQRQRTESMRLLRDCTGLRRDADAADDMAGMLLLDNIIFALEGELRWLDHVEATVLRRGGKALPPAVLRRRPRAGAADATRGRAVAGSGVAGSGAAASGDGRGGGADAGTARTETAGAETAGGGTAGTGRAGTGTASTETAGAGTAGPTRGAAGPAR
jgi:DNA-binding PadR family transcriptional regulator